MFNCKKILHLSSLIPTVKGSLQKKQKTNMFSVYTKYRLINPYGNSFIPSYPYQHIPQISVLEFNKNANPKWQ